MRFLFFIIPCLFLACSQAGFYEDTSTSINNAQTSYLVKGYLGVGALSGASISIVDINNYDAPKIIETTTSDSKGFFEFELTDAQDGLILVVANNGTYLDPFSYNTISGTGYEMKALYESKNIILLGELYITPFSTLFAELFDCFYHQSSLGSDPYIYSKSIFNDVFEVDMDNVRDLYLNNSLDDYAEGDILYTLYNLAFSKMAVLKNASSGLDVLSVFANELADSCTLITSNDVLSFKYMFQAESFRADFLDALLALKNDKVFSELANSLSLDDLVVSIRNKQNLIFGFHAYEDY